MGRISKTLLFPVNLFPVFCFSVGAYAGFAGGAPWGLWGSAAFVLGALLFLFLAVRSLLKPSPPSRERREELKSKGERIVTLFRAIDRNWSVQVNGRSPVVIYSRDGAGNAYRSGDLWFSGEDSSSWDDPRFRAWQALQAADPGKKYLIPVYVDPRKREDYYMAVEELAVE